MTFSFVIPDDLEEKSYKVFYELSGKTAETSLFVQGAKIEVNASLDKNMYAENDTAVLTLEVKNLRNLDLELFSRVKFNEYDNLTYFNLSGSDSKTLIFNIPIHFTGDKIFYSIYMASGRSLYINSIYAYEKPREDNGITLYTDKQVYNTGENVYVFINATKDGTLNLTAPDFTTTKALNAGDSTVISFIVPESKSGTYYIDYTFDNVSFSYPFDVNGYSAKILEFTLDKEIYDIGDSMDMKMLIESNRNFSGTMKMWVYGKSTEDSFEFNKEFVKGENKIEINRTLNTNWSGIHSVVYGIYADIAGRSVLLASGAEYFDVVDHVPPLITITSPQNIVYTTSTVPLTFAIEDTSDIEWIGYSLNGTDNVTISGSTLLTDLTNGAHTIVIYAKDSAGNIGSAPVDFTVNVVQQDTVPPTIESVTLYPANTTAGSRINISVLASDNIGIAEVTANNTPLTNSNGLWSGSITAASSVGSYTVTIRAKDAAGNTAEKSVKYSVVNRVGGIAVTSIPKPLTINQSINPSGLLNVKLISTANIDDTVELIINTNGISATSAANLSWFNRTFVRVQVPAGKTVYVPFTVTVPPGTPSGYKTFKNSAKSLGFNATSVDTGVVYVKQ